MRIYRTQKGYFYKEYKNGKKKRISKEDYLKLKKKHVMKGGDTCKLCGGGGYFKCLGGCKSWCPKSGTISTFELFENSSNNSSYFHIKCKQCHTNN